MVSHAKFQILKYSNLPVAQPKSVIISDYVVLAVLEWNGVRGMNDYRLPSHWLQRMKWFFTVANDSPSLPETW